MDSRSRHIMGAALALAGCTGNQALKSWPADAGQVAQIVMTASTNSASIEVVVNGDASAFRTIGRTQGSISGTPANFPAGSRQGTTFLSDLAAVGDLAKIPINSACAKSVSFGTTTRITADGQTSGDLQCVANPTPAVSALITAVNALLDDTP